VRHEHFASQVIEDALRTLRMSLPAADKGLAILATLPGETHGLGMQVVALLCALNGVRTRILGTEMPSDEIVGAARETKATFVALSVSLATSGVATDRKLAALRRALPADVGLVIGGGGARGARRPAHGIEHVEGLDGFEAWLQALFGAPGDG
jgi:methanogenic corrinoid protein MtbC1